MARWRCRVNTISPGLIPIPDLLHLGMNQDQVDAFIAAGTVALPIGRPGTTGEIARAVVLLASDDSSDITGTELFVDAGLTQVRCIN